MAIKRLFLNWDKPLLVSSALELLKQADGNIFFDLSNLLVVIPTSHAIKSLSYKLTEIASQKGCAVLLPKFVTPQFFFTCQECEKVPSETQRIFFWIESIKININNLTSLFPDKLKKSKDFSWYLGKAEKIIELADTLASVGMTIGEIVSKNSNALQNDLERFVELSKIEAAYFQLLNKAGFEDTNKVKMKNALNPKLSNGITKVIFIAVPDPIPIVIETINILSSSIDIEVWINASPDFDSAFDTFGRPIFDFWKDKDLDIPDFKNSVTLFDSPRDLATNLVNLISEKDDSINREININNISIIMPDTSLEIAIRHSFFKHGIKTFDPSGVRLNKTRPFFLFNAIVEFILVQDYRSLANLIRNADFLSYIKSKVDNLNYAKLFSINDYLQNKYMPVSFSDMLNAIKMEIKKQDKQSFLQNLVGTVRRNRPLQFGALGEVALSLPTLQEIQPDKTSLDLYSQALMITKDLLINEEGKFLTESALSKVIEIYDLIQSNVVPELKEYLSGSINAIKDIVDEVKESFGPNYKYENKDVAFLTIKRVQNTTLYPLQEDGTLPLRGWLELQWEEKKPFTFVLGMNEGIVPSVTTNDIFLPDSLKKKLNLPCHDSRFVRDLFILSSVLESQTEYPLNFVVMKTNGKGEYLKPSRLLLQTSDQGSFYERINYLFRGKSIIFEKENNTIAEAPLKHRTSDIELSTATALEFHSDKTPKTKISPEPQSGNQYRKDTICCVSTKVTSCKENHYPFIYSIPFKKLEENKLSVTDFKSYLECPFRFYLKKYLGYEEGIDDIKTDLDNREFGSICHETLKLLGEKLKEKTDKKDLKSLLAKKLTHEKSKFSPSIPVEFSFYSLGQRLNKALEIMLQDAENSEWEILDLEKDFNFTLNSDKLGKWLGSPVEKEISFVIKGRIDRIDISKDGKLLKIIDYKTGNVSATPRKEHYKSISTRTNESLIKEYAKFEINGKEYVWIDLQLPLYAIILQEIPEYKNLKIKDCAYFVIPKAVTNTQIVSWENMSLQELDAARKCTAQIVLNIANNIFWPPSEKVKYDNYETILYNVSQTSFNSKAWES